LYETFRESGECIIAQAVTERLLTNTITANEVNIVCGVVANDCISFENVQRVIFGVDRK
jgi:hypothetical protein